MDIPLYFIEWFVCDIAVLMICFESALKIDKDKIFWINICTAVAFAISLFSVALTVSTKPLEGFGTFVFLARTILSIWLQAKEVFAFQSIHMRGAPADELRKTKIKAFYLCVGLQLIVFILHLVVCILQISGSLPQPNILLQEGFLVLKFTGGLGWALVLYLGRPTYGWHTRSRVFELIPSGSAAAAGFIAAVFGLVQLLQRGEIWYLYLWANAIELWVYILCSLVRKGVKFKFIRDGGGRDRDESLSYMDLA